MVIEGRTMGTTYRIIYFDEPRHRNFQFSVDSLLTLINKSINTYDTASEISRFNQSANGITLQLPFLYRCLRKSQEIYSASGGAFDPTVMPLVNAWGFGPGKPALPAAGKIDSLATLVGFNKIGWCEKEISKADPRMQLDMGGIGQGFGADVIFQFLRLKGIKDMLVELGGEGIAGGKNLKRNKRWRIGILDPNSTIENQFFKAYVTLKNRAFTTAGNYFNYRIIDGRKYGHTIDPVSGYPIQHSLLSVSLFAEDCTTADGWDTAFMVMGLEKSIAQLQLMPKIDALLIYSADDGTIRTYITPGLKKFITLEK
jgi:thiamine biosynthesis lipoprotein